jgi:hypothetical protein
MPDVGDDEQRIVTAVMDFAVAVERGVPREMASLMCEEEARDFLDSVADPDVEEPVVVEDMAPVRIAAVRVFGDRALVRFRRRTDEVRTLYCRREADRWTVCANAEDDLTAEQLDEDLRLRTAATSTPLGSLSDDQLGELLGHGVCLGVLVPRALDRVEWQSRYGVLSGLVGAMFGVGAAYWAGDVVSSTRARILAEQLSRTAGPPRTSAMAFLSSLP